MVEYARNQQNVSSRIINSASTQNRQLKSFVDNRPKTDIVFPEQDSLSQLIDNIATSGRQPFQLRGRAGKEVQQNVSTEQAPANVILQRYKESITSPPQPVIQRVVMKIADEVDRSSKTRDIRSAHEVDMSADSVGRLTEQTVIDFNSGNFGPEADNSLVAHCDGRTVANKTPGQLGGELVNKNFKNDMNLTIWACNSAKEDEDGSSFAKKLKEDISGRVDTDGQMMNNVKITGSKGILIIAPDYSNDYGIFQDSPPGYSYGDYLRECDKNDSKTRLKIESFFQNYIDGVSNESEMNIASIICIKLKNASLVRSLDRHKLIEGSSLENKKKAAKDCINTYSVSLNKIEKLLQVCLEIINDTAVNGALTELDRKIEKHKQRAQKNQETYMTNFLLIGERMVNSWQQY